MIETYPRWNTDYTRNALERDPGVDVHCLMMHPDIKELGDGRGYLQAFPSEEELFQYDVVFLGDIGIGPNQLTEQQGAMLRRLVERQAGGLGLHARFSWLSIGPHGILSRRSPACRLRHTGATRCGWVTPSPVPIDGTRKSQLAHPPRNL